MEISENLLVSSDIQELAEDIFVGCDCSGGLCNDSENCLCVRLSLGPSYDTEGHILLGDPSNQMQKPVLECHAECSCSGRCKNRMASTPTRHKYREHLEVIELEKKGRGVITKCRIPKFSFICEYVGEMLDFKMAKQRLEMEKGENTTYMILLREHFASSQRTTYAIDARFYGNISRYINHSCEPNLSGFIFRSGCDVPRMGLFALLDIEPFEELSYAYGDVNSELSSTVCYCKSYQCKGFLPLDML